MSFPFEVKYIQVRYVNKKIIGSIKESKYSLSIDKVGDNEFLIDTITYPKLENGEAGQLAFRILDDSVIGTPYFIIGDINKELISIQDPDSNKIWWIENGSWKEIRNNTGKIIYRDSVICRTVGTTKIKIDTYECLIKINSLSFTVDQLHYYLGDFKDSLAELVWSDSYVSASLPGKSIKFDSENFLDLLSQFVKFTEKIVDSPKKELREQQSKRNYKKVRPVSKTFMEVATKGFSKELTSRDYIESFNVSENRYIYSIVNRIYIQSKSLNNILYKRVSNLKKEISSATRRINKFCDYIEIDQESCENHIDYLKGKVKEENNQLVKILSEDIVISNLYLNNDYQSLTGNVAPFYMMGTSDLKGDNYGGVSFFGKWKANKEDEWYKLDENIHLKYQFNKSILDGDFKFRKFEEYKVIADVSPRRCGKLSIYKVNYVYEISQECVERKMCFRISKSPIIKGGIVSFRGYSKAKKEDSWYLNADYNFLFEFDSNIFGGFFQLNGEYKIIGRVVQREASEK